MAANVDFSVLQQMVTNAGDTVMELSYRQPVMLIFLRHFGCTFCREALADIAKKREKIESLGSQVVFVHMADFATAERYFQRYDLPGVIHVSDPECAFYAAFGLAKGNFTQLFGLQSWIRGFDSAIVHGRGIGWQIGDGFQMPGIFVLQDGEIKEAFIHKLSSTRPDYIGLVRRCCELA